MRCGMMIKDADQSLRIGRAEYDMISNILKNGSEREMAKPVKIRKPKLAPDLAVCTDLRSALQESVEMEDDIIDLHIQGQTLENEEFDNLYFENVRFDHCTFSKVLMERCSFRNVVFDSCAFPNCDFSRSWFGQCEFKSSQLVGCNFGESRFTDFIVEKSALRYANFTSAQFDKCLIADCDLSDTFFAGCTLKSFETYGSQFIRTEFFRTALKNVDFSACELEGICVSENAEELKGAVVNTFQAVELSRLLGLVIKEDE